MLSLRRLLLSITMLSCGLACIGFIFNTPIRMSPQYDGQMAAVGVAVFSTPFLIFGSIGTLIGRTYEAVLIALALVLFTLLIG